MLLFSNYIMYSEIDGFGLFTAQDIPEGQEVWKFNPLIDKYLTEEEVKTLPGHFQKLITKYGVSGDRKKVMLSLDNNKFTNHSIRPNVIKVEERIVAARNIAEDEEITQNYGNMQTN
jgi:SET domain-containing protein